MHCQVRSAERTLFDGDAVMVMAHGARGDFAVMARHAPLLAALDPGPLRIKTSTGERVFVLHGGLLHVRENRVAVLAYTAVAAAEVDLPTVKARIPKIEALLAQTEEKASLLRELAYLRAQERARERHAA